MKRYNKYVVTGVQWIPEIPQHWSLGKVKYFYKMTTGFTPATKNSNYYDAEKGYDWVTIGDLKGRVIYNSTNKISSLAINDYSPTPTPKGSLMYSFKLSVGLVGFAGKELYTNEAIASFLEDSKTCLPYLYYAAPFFIEFNANTNIYGAHIMNQELIKNALIAFPPIDEQKAIANYLDEQCAKIDKVIAAQEKRVELLQELKQSIITRAVTKGINSHVKMRDSGVEWIGQIPEYWEIKKLKYLFSNLDYLRQPITADQRSKNNPIYDYYGASGIIDKIDFYNVDDTVLLIGEDGANLVFRNLPLIYKASGKFWVNNHAHILKPLIGVDYEYMYYTMECADYSTFITGSAQPKLSQENMNQVQYPLPPLSEQCKISKYIERKTIKIDSFITKALCQIELLKEYKQSLITEVVTGKRKVS